ncbi:hypothetical protein CAEBREN_08324 [Caenorhabditis brenneri]|uniref:TIL domain-containing protein n=1 Tax=Caenorhabditis brenneri TaxID=135651 RepID=G0N3V2_CAEBE|nr:hypothetical protein CAEBREN_08324 [Caenorhabditis brenneri]
MKCLLIILILAIASIQCFESLDCLKDSDCPSNDQSCIRGECRADIPKGGSDSIPCVPECPSNEACYWGTCVRASRKIVQRKMSWPNCLADWHCKPLQLCVVGVCVGVVL